jgi:signal transduction histidine kinase
MTVSRRILIHVALGAAFVLAVATAVTYALVYDALTKRDLQHLDTYVRDRQEREEARFLQVQTNLALVRAQFLKRLEIPMSQEHLEERFNYWYRRYADGAWRSREQFGDARKTSSMWADRDWPATPEMRRQTLIAQELCDEMLAGWVDVFPSFYFQFPKPGLVNVGVDVLLADWSWKMPAHFDTAGLEWIALALPEGVPPDRFSWTGLQQDDVISEPLICVYLPVVKGGVFLASVGHNMAASRLIDAAVRSEIPGALHYIFRTDGRLIAHPTKRADILVSKGLLTAQACGDSVLASLYRIAGARSERRFSGFDQASDTYYSVARLAGPEWFYVTAMSRARLQQQAFASAQWVLWSGLFSLALVLGFIAAVVRTQVARPLAELTRATEAMSAGTAGVPVPKVRADELGALAKSFGVMVEKVAAREGELRQLNLDLEKRVADRTEDLNQALDRERELGEMKSNFVSLVSHEFRTPLGVIMSAADVLDRYFERLPAEKRARHLEMIQRSTKNLAALIEEVLLLSRVEEGRMKFAPVALDLEKFCRTLCDELRSATGGTCPIRFHAATPLDGAVSDEGVLRHIVSNLLSNACKYSEPGSPVDFTIERRNGEAQLVIRDHGIGIPAEDQARLFTSFTRGRNVGTRPGTGLGLVIVQRCVQLHGGTIAIASAPGEGTTVTVTLPLFSNQQPTIADPP